MSSVMILPCLEDFLCLMMETEECHCFVCIHLGKATTRTTVRRESISTLDSLDTDRSRGHLLSGYVRW